MKIEAFSLHSGKIVKTKPEVEHAQESPVQLKKAVSKPTRRSRTAVSTKAVKRERAAPGLDDSAGEELQTEDRPSVKPKKQKPVKSNSQQQTEPDDKGTLVQPQDQPKSKRKPAASEGGNGNGASAGATNAVANVRPLTNRNLLHSRPCLHCIAVCPNLDPRLHTLISLGGMPTVKMIEALPRLHIRHPYIPNSENPNLLDSFGARFIMQSLIVLLKSLLASPT